MNSWQTLRQLQYLLETRDWTGSSNPVFHEDAVIIAAAASEEIAEKVIMPAVVIRPGGETSDPEFPGYIDQEVVLRLIVAHAGDAYGEFSVVGGMRDGQTDSNGRGILEVEEELMATAKLLGTDSGIRVLHKATSALQMAFVANQFMIYRDYLFSIRTSVDRFYHPVINLQES